MLLLLFAGASATSSSTGTPLTVTKCCFQPSAFQNNAFQNCGATAVGWMPEWGFRHDPAELERRLAAQKSERRWYDDFLAAAKAVRVRANTTKSEKQRRALIYAAELAADAVAEAIAEEREAPPALIAELAAAAGASRVTASIRHAETVIAMVAEWEDEDEIMLLLS